MSLTSLGAQDPRLCPQWVAGRGSVHSNLSCVFVNGVTLSHLLGLSEHQLFHLNQGHNTLHLKRLSWGLWR